MSILNECYKNNFNYRHFFTAVQGIRAGCYSRRAGRIRNEFPDRYTCQLQTYGGFPALQELKPSPGGKRLFHIPLKSYLTVVRSWIVTAIPNSQHYCFPMKRLNLIIWITALLLPFAIPRRADAQSYSQQKRTGSENVKVTTRPVDDYCEVIVQNENPYDITLTLKLAGENYRTSMRVPLQKVYPPHSTTAALKIYRVDKNKSVSIRTNFAWFMGDIDARHNDAYIYALPYRRGQAFRLGQGPNGAFSHSGRSRYAVDFVMPVGTPVYAAREGVVISTKDDSDQGGSSKKYMESANYVIIRHDDGTFGEYAHLMKNGVSVDVGDYVRKSERIGQSGNTGYSSGPHLHFMVTRTLKDGSTQSVPFRFRSARGIISQPKEGLVYRAN